MTRWKLILEYDGGPFVGWQRQANGPSVQAALETAVYRFRARTGRCAGCRANQIQDVHALGQVAHIDLAKGADAETVQDAD